MRSSSFFRFPAVACALFFALAALIVHPVVETGIIDDWSYVKTAQMLAQTGHLVYNGWATAMLGWQVYLGALFIKIFGFSFLVLRVQTILIAMGTAFLLQRCFVRCGITEWNATVATLMLIFSTLFFPLSMTFMTDTAGVFVIVLCLYTCLRSLEAKTNRAAMMWICLAVALNAAGGTVRQIAWLGMLVMVPSALWLMRRRGRVTVAGLAALVAGVAFMLGCMHWVSLQPYSVPESILPPRFGRHEAVHLAESLLLAWFTLPLIILPLTLAYIAALGRCSRRAVGVVVAVTLLVGTVFAVAVIHRHRGVFGMLTMPGGLYLRQEVRQGLLVGGRGALGVSQDALYTTYKILLTMVSVAGVATVAAMWLSRTERPADGPTVREGGLSWSELGILLAPFCAAYVLFLCPRASDNPVMNRYLAPLGAIALIPLVKYYQENIAGRLPRFCVVLLVLVAAYSVASTHDYFAMARARLVAVAELHEAGVPDDAIDAGPEANGWKYLERYSTMNEVKVRIPAHIFIPTPSYAVGDWCHPLWGRLMPKFAPLYFLSLDPKSCAGPAPFPPVTYKTWLAPYESNLYVTKYGPLKTY